MIKGNNIYIRPLNIEDAVELLRLETENREIFEKFSMTRSNDFYTMENQIKRITKNQETMLEGQEYNFGIFINNNDKLIGTISLFQVIRGSLQNAIIGYFLDERSNGKGYATEAVKLVIDYAFNELMLHRIEAGVMPHNIASMRVLEKAGFHKEGISQKNVKINGIWEDHQVLAIINPHDQM
ncbi:GNAT family N-acetyltransferase [Paenibacillus sp. KQZ6P-2]|uniref:GNAT family N-acetyltransferase n=1 Tax=Paenibacillus mangrovi TaxID=2931978 RepID=A0A9X2B2H3_9BACL|nr:GNAT family protein [Paenibacillus mangrovi]MCJ8012331.1 GNAT family N-acetyltransferase [Paenibacillus mangrovi]